MPTVDNDNAIRKAAVLIRSLDGEAAAALLSRLSADEARALRAAVQELGEVTDDDRQGVAAAMRTPDSRGIEQMTNGVELTLGQAQPEQRTIPTYQQPSATPAESAVEEPVAFLGEADPASLVPYLQHELPQTIATVLSCLPADRAAAVLGALPSDRQVAVLDRLADLGDADPESLQVITSGLRDWIADHQQRRDRRTKRLSTIQAILTAAPAATRDDLLDAVGDRDWRHELTMSWQAPPPAAVKTKAAPAEPAAAPEPEEVSYNEEPLAPAETATDEPPTTPAEPAPLVSFSDVEGFPVSALAQVMRHTPADYLLLALAGGSDRLVQRIAAALPRRQAAELRQRVSRIGPTRLRDIEQSQACVARVASDLLRRGWISMPAASSRKA